MTLILGLSGKKQSGKNTCLNWIMGNYMVGLELIDWIRINEKGQMVVPAQVGDEIQDGIFDVDNPAAASYLDQYVWPFVKQYSFAIPLKEFCINMFGLTRAQAYGTNDDKNTETKLHWENMPYCPNCLIDGNYIKKKSGPMTARQVLQYFGTNICRQIYDNCWVDATIHRIQTEQSQLAIITDVRFQNEVKGIQDAGGKVIRFTRAPFAGQDEHYSEMALDGYTGFDAIIDNKNMDIKVQNKAVTELLIDWKYLEWEMLDQKQPITL